MASNGSQDSAHSGRRRSGKKPMQFMFIDSTTHGVNAKPDKAVRSFVMKSARSKKPWSTRQKSPRTEEADGQADSSPEVKRSPTRTHSRAEDVSPANVGPWPEFPPSPYAPSNRSTGSVSSTSGSFFSSRTYSQPYITSPASRGSVCDNPNCSGEICGQPHEAHTALARRDGFAVGFTSEFDCLPVKTDDKMRTLIHNFVNVYSTLLIPLDHHQSSKTSTTNWVSKGILSTTGASFIYAVLASSALYPQATCTIRPGDVLYYKNEAIRNINKLLSDPKNAVDDNNVTAVFVLLNLEESQLAARAGDQDAESSQLQMITHLNGLKAMIEQRGGLAAFNSNLCLQTFILMHSIAHVVITFQRPYTTLVNATGQIQPYDLPSFRGRPSSARTHRLFQPLKLDPTLTEIIADAVVFIGDLAVWFEDRKCPVNPLELQKHVCLLEYRLFDWYKQGEEDPNLHQNAVDQSVCLALLIFLVIAHERHYHLVVQTAAQKLKCALDKCLLSWGKSTDILMWTLTIGALATQNTENFVCFKQYCAMAFLSQGFDEFTNAEEMLDRMRKCLWLPKLDDDVKKLWAQMGFCKGEEVVETIEEEHLSADRIKKEHVLGSLTSDRFFGKRSESR